MKLPPLVENDFLIPSEGARVRVATIDRPRFTRWDATETEVRDGFVVPPTGSAMIAVAHRHGKADGTPRIGFLTGWGRLARRLLHHRLARQP